MFPLSYRQVLSRAGGPSTWSLWIHVCCLSALVASHDLTSLSTPQFWAEDGVVWYREAYELGAASLLREQTGYFQSLPRLVALLATFVPLAWGPVVFVWISLIFQVLPAILLLSPRMDGSGVPHPARLVLAYFCVVAPNAWEIHLNLTNSQWFLALAAFLLIFSDPPASFRGRILDTLTITLSTLTGPFSILLAPIAVWRWFVNRSGFALWRAVLLLLGAVVQAFSVLRTAGAARSVAPLGASFVGFAEIVAGQILLAGTLGQRVGTAVIEAAGAWYPLISVLLVLIGCAAVFVAWRREKSSFFRAFLLFATALLAAALLSPQVSVDAPQWAVLAVPGNGGRYFFIPILAWFTCVLVIAARTTGAVSGAACFVAALFAVGIIGDWRHVSFPDKKFHEKAELFESLPSGRLMTFEIAPEGWFMTLRKRY
jgi:hypothetical protein